MILVIDTTDRECKVGFFDGANIDRIKWCWEKDTGTEVLENIDKLLKKRQKKLKSVKTILVNQGPGSYTGTRVGITIANTLGWSLNIPVFGYSGKDFKEIAKEIFKKLKSGKIPLDHFPTPIYE